MAKILRAIFYLIIGRFIILVILGIDIKRRELLPAKGPAIIAANHNSHLDILLLMSILPWKAALNAYPVAAADYFLKNKIMSWFSHNIVGIIPIKRKPSAADRDILAPCYDKLSDGKIIIIFPEGSRGEPEVMGELKSGIAHIVKRMPEVNVVPVFIRGLGKALPKGEALLVPLICKVYVGESISAISDKVKLMEALKNSFEALSHEEKHSDFK
ncbi:MAG: 1-acyl-sn-glycerol-3-phosphate acyltransferase [Elusimicrobiota bacterium]|jgi:1-acyl-sn-glycerol-3-phosphate acyltransferase|nr:1-acyl-sn-glycerol-3-phosphate acyltransferase [Elusimicrobiota bacterium]